MTQENPNTTDNTSTIQLASLPKMFMKDTEKYLPHIQSDLEILLLKLPEKSLISCLAVGMILVLKRPLNPKNCFHVGCEAFSSKFSFFYRI